MRLPTLSTLLCGMIDILDNAQTVISAPSRARTLHDALQSTIEKYEAEKAAHDTHLANNGPPGRVVTLAEAVAPTKFVLVVPFRGLDGIVPVKGRDYTGDLEQAQFAQHQYRLGGSAADVYGLVPVKE